MESPGNQRLDDILFKGMNRHTKIGYIPSTEDPDRTYFQTKADYYRHYGVEEIMFFDLYSDFDSSKIEELLSCDIVHLSAGNPIEFQSALAHRKMDQVLREYFNRGGTIVGVSGGAVQLGKSITLFQLFTGESGRKLKGLQLADFEFLPHYNRWDDAFKKKVEQYAVETGITVYAGNDGDGMVVEDGHIQFIGEIKIING
ncbi:Type 1 glutamine amidotransferase-like domain-containing protein [Jeotgalibacillus haloalkalitolerans]|uniref:Type 1 glutamine amidotransferase-like domain-containing protein n=1 Tax=Jeotgalibacillus haloalkalitolerans TaxID=3104292 RepID=A0ABU5KIF1_9BACL|nr:Type 1 glutamine amidotransferase-like domain-containing protein [Jeotgalibacillus sp. HH7-29]MDZ5710696.1 Type 1 glutamine amidotransferase-like domain-containing protein [Jeotgalibacillus sp. HH7-29]